MAAHGCTHRRRLTPAAGAGDCLGDRDGHPAMAFRSMPGLAFICSAPTAQLPASLASSRQPPAEVLSAAACDRRLTVPAGTPFEPPSGREHANAGSAAATLWWCMGPCQVTRRKSVVKLFLEGLVSSHTSVKSLGKRVIRRHSQFSHRKCFQLINCMGN